MKILFKTIKIIPLYAKWYDKTSGYSLSESLVFTNTYVANSTVESTNKIIKFKPNSSSDAWNNTVGGVNINGGTTSDRYISVDLSSITTDAKISVLATAGTSGRYISIGTTANKTTTTASTTCVLLDNSTTLKKYEFEIKKEDKGVYYINFNGGNVQINNINVYVISEQEVLDISGDVSELKNTITVSNVKFTVDENNPSQADATGYKVYLDDDTDEATVTNGVIENVSAGSHKVTLKYGEYTVKEYNVEVGIISSTTYELRAGVTNGVLDEVKTFQGTTGTIADGKISVDATTGKLDIKTTEWAQFNNGTKLSFYVKAGAKVTLSGYKDTVVSMTGIDGDQTFAANYDTISKTYTTDTVVVIEAKSNGYIGTLTIGYPIIVETSILFGTDGNTSSPISGVAITANMNNNGTNCAYVYNGNIEFRVAAGAKVEVYSNYKADYTINGVAVTSAGQAFYDYDVDTDVVIECDLDGNGDNNFYWIKITFPNA